MAGYVTKVATSLAPEDLVFGRIGDRAAAGLRTALGGEVVSA